MSSRIDPFDRAMRRVSAETPALNKPENAIALRRLFQLGVEEGMKQVESSVVRMKEELYRKEKQQ
jgi:hypothetical protein